jgi:plastocyanin
VSPTPAPAVQAGAVVQAVQIADDAFAPPAISVPVGTTLVWSRSGAHPHTVTADDGSFDSGVLRGPQTFEHTFTTAGEFAYYCDIHGGPGGAGMSARVIVTR